MTSIRIRSRATNARKLARERLIGATIVLAAIVGVATRLDWTNGGAFAQTSETTRALDSQRDEFQNFRYWMAPEKAIDRWPWGDKKYYPVSVERFQEWLRTSEETRRSREYLDGSRYLGVLGAVKLEARLEGNALVGEGRLDLKPSPFAQSREPGDDFSLFPLAPFSMALSYEPTAFADMLGAYPDGRLYLPNLEAKSRSFHWSQRGEVDASGALVFHLSFPNSLDGELTLTTSDSEFVASTDVALQEESTANASRLWRVRFGGRSSGTLAITRAPSSGGSAATRGVGVRQEIAYRANLEGVEVATKFEFERSDKRVVEATLAFDSALAPTAIEWGKSQYLEIPAPQIDENGVARIRLRAPTLEKDESLGELKFSAFYALPNETSALPRVQIEGDGLEWRETLCRAIVSKPLVASEINPIDAAQTRETSRAKQDDQDLFTFKYFNPDARIVMKFSRAHAKPIFDSATEILFTGNDASAKTTLLLNFENSESRRVPIKLASGWEVDSVQTSQNEPILPTRDHDSNDSANRTLYLSLRTPPIPNQPTKITLFARRVEPIEEMIPVDALCPIDLSDSFQGAHALLLKTDSSSQVKLTTRKGRPVSPSKSTPNFIFGESQIRETLSSAQGALRLYFGDQTVDVFASLENAHSNYSTELSGYCEITDENFEETWKLRCYPATGMRVERIVFFVSPGEEDQENSSGTVANDLSWRWSASNEPQRAHEAIRLSREEREALRAPENTDAYEIKLVTSRSVPFDLNVYCSIPNTSEIQAPLLFFPESNGAAEIVVDSASNRPFRTRVDALLESTAPRSSNLKRDTLKKAFRYNPSSIFDATSEQDEENGANLRLADQKTPQLEIELLPFAREDDRSGVVLPLNAICWFENYDSNYCNDGSITHRASFYLENRGRNALRFVIEKEKGESKRSTASNDSDEEPYDPEEDEELEETRRAVRAVWLDERPTLWSIERLRDDSEESKFALDVRLLPNEKFVCVEIEYCDGRKTSLTGKRLKPMKIACEAPTLSGVWNAWLPPQYMTRANQYSRISRNAAQRWTRQIVEFFRPASENDDSIDDAAERVALRLGDKFAMQSAVSESRSLESDAPEELRLDAETWGDVFGSPTLVKRLFAPNATDDDARAIDSAFGKILPDANDVSFYIDRFALARAGVAPTTPLPAIEWKSSPSGASRSQEYVDFLRARADKLLESSGLVLLIVSSDFVALTTKDALAREFDLETSPLRGSAFQRVVSRARARRAKETITLGASTRFVSPEFWRGLEEATSPWKPRVDREIALGWTRTSAPLGRAEDGVYVVNRYFLSALELFALLIVLASYKPLWKAGPRFLIGMIGVCVAILYVTQYELASLATGALFGAGAILVWKIAQATTPLKEEKAAEPTTKNGDADDDVSQPSRKRQGDEDDFEESESSEGFVDFDLMPPEDARRLRAPGETRDDAPNRDGRTTTRALVALVACALALGAALIFSNEISGQDQAREPDEALRELDELFTLSNEYGVEAENEADERGSEPRRVFVPTNDQGERVGDSYWIDSEFYKHIRETLRDRPRERNWRVVDALYKGVVSYNSLTATTSLFELKAYYTIVTNEESATLVLPTLQLPSEGGAKFDSLAISPSYGDGEKEMFFYVDAPPGEHLLELSLVPPPFGGAQTSFSLPIVRCPSSRLELDITPDVPTLDVPNARGAITRASGKFIAELGAVDELTLVRKETGADAKKTTIDAEQYFLMRPRATQTDARAVFHYQVTGGKISTLEIECDPAFTFSGYCKCDAAEIESVESPTTQNPAMKIAFKKPTSGSFTVNVDFVARNFSGVGRSPLPRIQTAGARVVRNLLALSPGAGVECDVEKGTDPQLNAEFLAAWGPLDSPLVAVYDLTTVEPNAVVKSRLSRRLPIVNEVSTYIFRPSFIETELDAQLDAETDVFQLELDAPELFVVDSVATFDENGEELETPAYLLDQRTLTLFFENPLKGKRAVKIVGRAKETIDLAQDFPEIKLKNVERQSRVVKLYCASNLCLKWLNLPTKWRFVDRRGQEEEEKIKSEDSEGTVYPFEFYSIEEDDASDEETLEETSVAVDANQSPEENESDQTNDSPQTSAATSPVDDRATILATMNAPSILGLERVYLFPYTNAVQQTSSWQAAYELRFKVESGRLDRIMVEADDLFDLDPLPANSNFTATVIKSESGARAYVFEPKRTLVDDDKENVLLFFTTFNSDAANVRLPNFQLIPSSLYEDYSRVAKLVVLATMQGKVEINWTTKNLTLYGGSNAEIDRERNKQVRNLSRGVRAMTLNGSSSVSLGDDEDGDEPDESRSTEVSVSSGLNPYLIEKFAVENDVSFSAYARGANASVNLTSQTDAFKVPLAEHMFYVNDRREIFGIAAFVIQPDVNESCVVAAPPRCNVLEATVNGSRRLVERVRDEQESEDEATNDADRETRWRVDLDGTPYVKRLVISFQSDARRHNRADERLSQRRSETFNVDFLRLEDAEIARELWVCAFEDFESNAVDARWKIRQIGVGDAAGFYERACNPILLADANPALFRLHQLETVVALNSYAADSARNAGAQNDDKGRFAARWIDALRAEDNALAQFALAPRDALVMNEKLSDAIVVVNNGAMAPVESVNELFPAPDKTAFNYGDSVALREKIADACAQELEKLPEKPKRRTASASPQSLWALEANATARILLGSSDSEIASIVVVAEPKTFDFFASPYATSVFILMATAALLQLLAADARKRRRKSLLLTALIFLWATFFFVFGWKAVGLAGAFLLTILPPIAAALRRRTTDSGRNRNDDATPTTEMLYPEEEEDAAHIGESSREIVESVSQLGDKRELLGEDGEDLVD